ncbi:predicted protein [Histoplasma capsulatum H143]|uniref:Uncharacterized protein n=1 Tax=Ajellomyces capsulatus (strain H143) TaxID=544712 RepID=C6H596_AJECH|nr:predicted protein [Histoplasma capsulatum H143]
MTLYLNANAKGERSGWVAIRACFVGMESSPAPSASSWSNHRSLFPNLFLRPGLSTSRKRTVHATLAGWRTGDMGALLWWCEEGRLHCPIGVFSFAVPVSHTI